MIDLHVHLDGSLSPTLVQKLADIQNIRLADNWQDALTAPVPCGSLARYLERFDLPLSVMQTADSIALCVEDLVTRLDAMGLLYAEIRFAPQLHLRRGLSQTEVVEAALAGLRRAKWSGPVHPQLLLCLMRGRENTTQNRETVRLAETYLGDGVAAIDLAGAEAAYSTSEFAEPFALAAARGIPFTIHAGEAAGAQSVAAAVGFGARRIGHGVRSVTDPQLLALLRQKEILLELCPTSNLQTGAAASAAEYPLRQLLDAGVRVCLNTDNMTVSGTDIQREYAFAHTILGLSYEDCVEMLCNAARGAFLPLGEQQKLLNAVHQSAQNTQWILPSNALTNG